MAPPRSTAALVIGTNVQAWDADLDAVAALASRGLAARTASNTWAARTITGTTNQVVVTNGDGVMGNPRYRFRKASPRPQVFSSPNGLGMSPTVLLDINTGASFNGINVMGSNTPAIQVGADTSNCLQFYWLTGAGYFGTINNTAPLHFAGSATTFDSPSTFTSGIAVKTAVKTTTYTVGAGDYYIIGNHATVPFTVTLLAASSNTGKEYKFKNKGAANMTVDATALGQIYTTSAVNTLVMANGDAATLTSDGATWVKN